MEYINLKTRNCKKAKELRKEGKVPGILYGKENMNFLFEIGEMELNQNIKKHGEHGIISVNFNGKSENALVKEIQRDPVKHNIIHIDLESINSDELINTEVPLHFENEGAIKSIGGILQKEKLSVKVQCKADKVPNKIDVDLGKLKIGDTLRVYDLEIGEELTFMDPLEMNILSVTYPNYIETGDDVVVNTEEKS